MRRAGVLIGLREADQLRQAALSAFRDGLAKLGTAQARRELGPWSYKLGVLDNFCVI